MEIAVLSDTHDHIDHTRKALELCKERGVAEIIHLGDFCSPFMIPLFEGFQLNAIFGNNDGDHYNILDKINGIGGKHHDQLYDLETGDKRIACYHGTSEAITEALVRSRMFDAVLSGHTHTRLMERTNNTCHINPGSVRGFDETPSFGILDTESIEFEFIEITA
jgi:putative phosphoesterase